jgi:hypothetical protein
MNLWSRVLVLVALPAAFSACYGSREPLGPVDRGQIDSELLGHWDCRPPEKESDERAALSVLVFDDHQYYAEWREDDKVERYRAYSTAVGGETLLNVVPLMSRLDRQDWLFVRYKVADSRLTLSVVHDKALKGLQGKAALRAIGRRAKEEALYTTVALCGPQVR